MFNHFLLFFRDLGGRHCPAAPAGTGNLGDSTLWLDNGATVSQRLIVRKLAPSRDLRCDFPKVESWLARGVYHRANPTRRLQPTLRLGSKPLFQGGAFGGRERLRAALLVDPDGGNAAAGSEVARKG